MAYHQYHNYAGEPHGSFETFQVHEGEEFDDGGDGLLDEGWYYWACFPGCMPDGNPTGPFETEAEAIADGQSSD